MTAWNKHTQELIKTTSDQTHFRQTLLQPHAIKQIKIAIIKIKRIAINNITNNLTKSALQICTICTITMRNTQITNPTYIGNI